MLTRVCEYMPGYYVMQGPYGLIFATQCSHLEMTLALQDIGALPKRDVAEVRIPAGLRPASAVAVRCWIRPVGSIDGSAKHHPGPECFPELVRWAACNKLPLLQRARVCPSDSERTVPSYGLDPDAFNAGEIESVRRVAVCSESHYGLMTSAILCALQRDLPNPSSQAILSPERLYNYTLSTRYLYGILPSRRPENGR
jgi:hypothetical protein